MFQRQEMHRGNLQIRQRWRTSVLDPLRHENRFAAAARWMDPQAY